MELSSTINADGLAYKLFIPHSEKQAQLESLANQSLSSGIDLYMKKDYEGAAKAFQRSVNLSPNSTLSVDTFKYLAQTYLKLNEIEKAIQTYKTAKSYHGDRDDLNTALGNLYFSENRFDEAVTQYKEAVSINPSANNHFSLGQGYLKTGKFNQAEREFNTVVRMEPESPNGNYGLGQTYSEQGYYEDAIEQFEAAIKLQKDFYDAYAEMGYAYADLRQMDKAREVADFLEEKDASLAETLNMYMYKVDPPKFAFGWADSSFGYRLSVNTPVSALDSYLEDGGASKIMTMKFMFTKEMERQSVENSFNWSISRSSGTGPGQAYNFGMPVPSTEVELPYYPENVYYDSDTLTATLYFTVEQNETADGTIDPSHIVFKFDGEDTYGISMNSDFDEFSGFSGIA